MDNQTQAAIQRWFNNYPGCEMDVTIVVNGEFTEEVQITSLEEALAMYEGMEPEGKVLYFPF